MKWYKIILFFYTVMLMIAAGCSRGGSAAEDQHIINLNDTTTPVIELKNPTDNQVITNGAIIKVEGKVTDNSLYQGSIRIKDDASGALVKEQLYEIHGAQSYDFYLEYKTSVTAVTNYTVTVQYEDHGFNVAVKTVKVKVNP